MKVCSNCGKILNDDDLFCTDCGTKVEVEKPKQVTNNKKQIVEKPKQVAHKQSKPSKARSYVVCLLCTVVAVVVLSAILGKDIIMYKYYMSKGDEEASISQSINYYTKALDLNYELHLVEKISEKVKEDENFEATLGNLEDVIKKSDLDGIYLDVYISKAKENFNNENYETTWNYLEKAREYNYDIESFEYYMDLVKISQEQVNEDVELDIDDVEEDLEYVNNWYIIPDSHIRYLEPEELSVYSKEELGYIRNEIFARHGYIFNTEKYNNYFSAMDWYVPNPFFEGNEGDLNIYEISNIELIKYLENK